MSIEDDIALLRGAPMLSVLGHEALRVLAIGAESRTIEQGDVLFYEGDVADAGYLVEEGVLTTVPSDLHPEKLAMGRGTFLGELSLLTETRRWATVMAAEPSSVMRIPRPLFLKMLQGYPEVAERLRQTLIDRVGNMTDDLGHVRRTLDPGNAPPATRPSKKPTS